MIKVEDMEVFNFEGAIRGLRNPMNSWDKSDSFSCADRLTCEGCPCEGVDDTCNSTVEMENVIVGQNDLDLMRRLYRAGTEHRKYLRQVFVSMDITAPLYWWKEFDTYKVGTVANSCSTMHKIHAKEFELDDFSHEHLFGDFEPIERRSATDYEVIFNTNNIILKSDTVLMCIIECLNFYREMYLKTKNKDYWWQMIQLLPSSYNQRRTVTMNYENVATIIKQRTGHKLDEWNEFVTMLKTLPYVKQITEETGTGDLIRA